VEVSCTRSILGAIVTLAFVVAMTGSAAGQDVEQPSADQRAAYRARMHELASSIKILAVPDKQESAVKLAAEPVLRYGDNTRQNPEAALWIWTDGGRPAAIAATEHYPDNPRDKLWLYEVASLSTGRIGAQRGSDLSWTAKEPGLILRPVPAADTPADKPVRRLAQMKTLHRRFAAHELEGVGGRIELRPLASPLYRYTDEAGGVLDGAIFALANGTNPEVFVVLEAGQAEGQPSAWQYGLARMTGAKTVVQLDGREVWSQEGADPPAIRANYFNGWLGAETPRE
jgi:hypothetical protein